MKRPLLLLILLLAAACPGKDLLLESGRTGEYRFDAPPGEKGILFFRARIKLPAPNEAWGFHALELSLNGKELPAPLNKTACLMDPQCRPAAAAPLRDPEGRFFVKADSDWTVFNSFSAGSGAGRANQTELDNTFYSFAFPLKELKEKDNVLTVKAVLPDYAARYPLEITDLEAVGCGRVLTFRRNFLQAVYPWSFPGREELCETAELTVARGETGTVSFSVYSFGPSEMKLPDDVQVYRLDNTVIPAKLKEAAASKDPNIREAYVPELLTPLKKGSTLALPQGCTTFFVKFRGETPGVHKLSGLPVRVRVLNFVLPDHEELPVENGMYIMAGGAEKQDIYPELREYGITQIMMTPWLTPVPLKIEDGKLQADFRKFDAGLRYLQERGINRRGVLFGTSEPMLGRIRELTGENLHGEEFQRRFREFLEILFDHAAELKTELFLSLFDEANFQKNNWENMKILTKIALSVPHSRMWSTMTELPAAAYLFDTLGYRPGRDLAVTHPFQLIGKKDDEVMNGVLTPGRKAGELRGRFHAEYDGITSYPGIGNRYVFGLRSRISGLKLLMGFAFWWGDMEKTNTAPVQCHYVSFPFREKETGVRFSTVGWEAVRTGIDDRRYIELAERVLAKKIGREAAEKQVKDVIDPPGGRMMPLTEFFTHARKELVKIIEENE